MSGELKAKDGTLLKRVPVIVRSWDGPNSRVGLEMDLSQMPWGPFDALGKRLNLLLPASEESTGTKPPPESQVEQALRHVEHAADRCGEFAQLANGNQDLWLRSQETWEWIRKYLTSLWVEVEVDGQEPPTFPQAAPEPEPTDSDSTPTPLPLPALPGAAATLRVAARALKATPLAVWRESMEPVDPDSPTREEAVLTLLGVARILSGQVSEGVSSPSNETAAPQAASVEALSPEAAPSPDEDPDQVSFDFAQGYDDGYQMGRRVGLALGAKRKSKDRPQDR